MRSAFTQATSWTQMMDERYVDVTGHVQFLAGHRFIGRDDVLAILSWGDLPAEFGNVELCGTQILRELLKLRPIILVKR